MLSWAPDARWLVFALRSLQRYATGFERVVVVYPDRDDAVMRPICELHGAEPHPQAEPPPPAGHLAQNATKCMADVLCPDASHVLHMDSDCVLTRATSSDEFFRDGKPLLVRRRWEHAEAADVWREPTRRALGWDPAWETMMYLPIVHDRATYGALRRHVEQLHGVDFSKYVLSQRPTWPYGFCEFNALGNLAVEQLADRYALLTTPDEPMPERPVEQQWSHGEITAAHEEWLEETLEHGRRRPPPPPGSMTAERRHLLGLD
jgi:hypothetical protein